MKKIFTTIWTEIKDFIVNPFWINKLSIAIIVLSFLLNGLIWYLYLKNYKDLIGAVPIGYSSAVILLNIFLANITYRKEFLVSSILISTGLFVQIIYLIFLKFFAMSQAF